ncbi:MAG TPA: hypothetical protein VJ845_03330, partial [Haploplasma sp.]|nr:hypothetical protein [Haploplasma sp.]
MKYIAKYTIIIVLKRLLKYLFTNIIHSNLLSCDKIKIEKRKVREKMRKKLFSLFLLVFAEGVY